MDSRQMQIAFQEYFDAAGTAINLISDQLFTYLTDAQEAMIDQWYKQYEVGQESTDNLRQLYVRGRELDQTSVGTSSGDATDKYQENAFTLPDDYFHYISYRCELKIGKVSKLRFGQIAHSDNVYRLLDDPFNTTSKELPLAHISDITLVV